MLRRKVHVSWLLASLSAGIVAGIIAAQYISLASPVWVGVGIGLAAVGLWRRSMYAVLFMVAAGCIIGLWRGSVTQQALTPYAHIAGHQVTLRGVVSEDADTGKNNETVLRLKDIYVDGHALPGAVWASGNTKLDIKRSDIVTVQGKLGDGFGNFSASMYRVTFLKAQHPVPGDEALKVRDWFSDGIRTAIPEPEASLGVGYLVGQRRSLPPELDNALRTAGLMHVVVASGYNLTILVRLARRLFVKVSKYLAILSGGAMIVAFVAVTGVSPSMSRAGLVAGLSLLAWYYGRKFHPLVLLPFAAAVTLLVNPSYGWNDLGWQLSFAAFGGVMIVSPLSQAYFFGDKKPGTVRQILGETIAAQLVTLPILIVAFGQFSNVAIIANLLILPLVPLAMLLTFIAGVLAIIFPPIATIVGLPASWLLHYMTTVSQYVAGLPWAQTELTISPFVAYGFYGVIIVACVYAWRKTKFKLQDNSIIE
jgi:competence protein ComEC